MYDDLSFSTQLWWNPIMDCFSPNKTKCSNGDYCSTVCKITHSLQEKKHSCSTTKMH